MERRRRRPRRQRRRNSGPGDRNDDPILEKGNRRTATARSGSAAYAFVDELDDRSERMIGALSSELMRLEVLKLDSLILTHDLITGKAILGRSEEQQRVRALQQRVRRVCSESKPVAKLEVLGDTQSGRPIRLVSLVFTFFVLATVVGTVRLDR